MTGVVARAGQSARHVGQTETKVAANADARCDSPRTKPRPPMLSGRKMQAATTRARSSGLSTRWRRVPRALLTAPSAHSVAAAVCPGGMH